MSGIIYWKYGFGSENANRQQRRIVEKELIHVKSLKAIISFFEDVVLSEGLDFEKSWAVCNRTWINKCDQINSLNLKSFYANSDYFKDQYPYTVVRKRKIISTWGILRGIWNHLDKINK